MDTQKITETEPKWQRARILKTDLFLWVMLGAPVTTTGYQIMYHHQTNKFVNTHQLVTRKGYWTNLFNEMGRLSIWCSETELQSELRWDDPPMMHVDEFVKQLSTDLN